MKKYDKTNSYGKKEQRTEITLTNAGVIRISALLQEIMKIRKGNGIAFLHDEDSEEWYLIRDDKDGFELRNETGNRAKTLVVNALLVTKELIRSSGKDYPSGVIPVSAAEVRGGVKHYPIITKAMRYSPRKPVKS